MTAPAWMQLPPEGWEAWSQAEREAWLAQRLRGQLGLDAAAAGADETWRVFGGGIRDAAQGLFDAGLWGAESLLAPLAGAVGNEVGLAAAVEDLRRGARLPEIADPAGVPGGLLREATRFAAGYGLFGPAAQAAGWLSPAGRAMLGGAMTDFAVYGPEEPRLSNLVEAHLPNPLTATLAARPDDAPLAGRLRSALEGMILGRMAEIVAGAVARAGPGAVPAVAAPAERPLIAQGAADGGAARGGGERGGTAPSPDGYEDDIAALLAPVFAPGPVAGIDGTRLTAPVIAGLDPASGRDIGLELPTLEWLGGQMVEDFRYAPPGSVAGGGGVFSAPRRPDPYATPPRAGTSITIDGRLDHLTRTPVLAHELGHAMDYHAGLSLSEILSLERDLAAEAEAASRRLRPELWAMPERRDYVTAPTELLADAASAYLLGPGRFKERYPALAAMLRAVWNRQPAARRWLQLNGVAWPALGLGAALDAPPAEERPQSPLWRSDGA